MIYFLYLSEILRIYSLIRILHGTYVSYCFLRWILGYFYSSLLWVLSYIHKPVQQINDKHFHTEIVENDFLLII